jgi:hypothetical protein
VVVVKLPVVKVVKYNSPHKEGKEKGKKGGN